MSALSYLHELLIRDATRLRKEAVTPRTQPPPTGGTGGLKDISYRFTYHAPDEDQQRAYKAIRNRAKEFAFLLDEKCPASDEKTWALHYLDMVVMNANASIARNGRS